MSSLAPLPSDESLRSAVVALFAADAITASADLRVGVLNGIAHLAEKVDSLEVREAAERLAKNVRRTNQSSMGNQRIERV